MPITKLYTNIALAIVVISSLIALFGLLNELGSGNSLNVTINELESWISGVGFSLALIVLAATGVSYLAKKK